MKSVKHRINKYLIYSVISFFLILISLNWLFPPDEMKEYSKVILDCKGDMLSAYLTKDDKWRMRTSLNNINPQLIDAIIHKEDKLFYYHFGVNPVSIIRALFDNIISGKRVSGASTITMQLARMLLPKERTYFNKLVELVRAVQIELRYSKSEILEMYLGLLPYGGNIEGVRSASKIYFNREPSELSLSQAVALTVIPNNPNKLRIDRNPIAVMSERDKWLNRFSEIFKTSDIDDAKNEQIESVRYPVPIRAPHFSLKVKDMFKNDTVRTSIDPVFQSISEKILKRYIDKVKIKGVSNGAVLIIDNKFCNIRAYCGSADFNDPTSQGEVDGLEAIRSPGSTLKPALFALNFDRGTLTPAMRLLDVPVDHYGYNPENYEREFSGMARADEALRKSLNIPAVEILADYGLDKFIGFLDKAGLSWIGKNKAKLGLSLILGGCGAKATELTQLFSIIARKGKLSPLTYRDQDSANYEEKTLLSEESCYLIADILSGIDRPDIPPELLEYTNLPKIAWKTGTSYGKRDAWAIGFNPRYTICIWLGNFNGSGSPHLSGAEMAVPLLFDIFNAIDHEKGKKWYDKPDRVLKREVCAETGLLPGKYCNQMVLDNYIENISHNRPCSLYSEFYISLDEKVNFCLECLPDSGYKKKAYPVYDPLYTVWMLQNNMDYITLPKHNDICPAILREKGPKIVSPSEHYEYLIESGSGQKILLMAAALPGSDKHYWYLNGKLFKKAATNEKVFFDPEEGENEIRVMDDKGRFTDIKIEVKFY